ncbi:MAG: alpha-glucosidase C-terminal domain-containing protein [Chloroflexi bacterium]|nr:alpha-glucosidase C-terminal domain-containing protein [Chloroflexota bacterium]
MTLAIDNKLRRLRWVLVCAILLAACQRFPTTPTVKLPTAEPTPTLIPTATYEPFVPTATPIPAVNAPSWGEDTTLYLILVASFHDSDGDGIGDLRGLTEKLDYLNDGNPNTNEDLGVNAIWLMPIFAAASYHGYDTTDHFTIRPEYGSREDLIHLVEECHKRGIRVLLDYVMAHVSNQHPFFQDAYGNPSSPYADWFLWYDEAHTRYKSFANIPIVPSVNGDCPAVREYALRVARYWMDLDGDGDLSDGVDGFRCDYALGLSHEFWKEIRSGIKALRSDFLLLGEVWSNAAEIAKFYEGQFDSTFDFPLYYILASHQDAVGRGVLGGTDKPGFIHASLVQRARLYPWGAQSVIFLNNHDTNRIMSTVQGDVQRAKLGATLLFTLPGTPLVYYGEEIGMAGVKGNGQPYWDEYRREPMDWYAAEEGPGMPIWFRPDDRNNHPHDGISVEEQQGNHDSLLSHYRRLIRLRQSYSALRRGSYERVEIMEGPSTVYAYLRQDAQAHLLVVLNFAREPAQVTVNLGSSTLPAPPWAASDLLGQRSLPPIRENTLSLALEAQEGLVLELRRPH